MKIVFLAVILATACLTHCATPKAKQATGRKGPPKANIADSERFLNVGWWIACRMYCNNYIMLCFPQWMDPLNLFYPHCEDQEKFGPPTEQCQQCLNMNGFPEAKPLLPTRPPRPIRPGKKTTTTPATMITDLEPIYPEPTICKCKRVQKVTTVTVSIACSDVTNEDGSCDISDPNARVTTSDESTCTCQEVEFYEYNNGDYKQ